MAPWTPKQPAAAARAALEAALANAGVGNIRLEGDGANNLILSVRKKVATIDRPRNADEQVNLLPEVLLGPDWDLFVDPRRGRLHLG